MPDLTGFARASEAFAVFPRLGLTSFGGPIAHLGYFRTEFVGRRRWLTERAVSDVVALSQFLPGPASSQTGFAIGLMRGGYLGGLAAWVGFMAPPLVVVLPCFVSVWSWPRRAGIRLFRNAIDLSRR